MNSFAIPSLPRFFKVPNNVDSTCAYTPDDTMASSDAAGGFLLSPAPSSVASTTSRASALPHPRSSPLKPGGAKESTLIRHVDARLLHINRRFAKRTTPSHASLSNEGRDDADVWGDVKGYASMKEACADISDLVGVVWVSGTPSLQVPYLINIALLLSSVVAGMPPTPRRLFRVLERLDHAFASLLLGRDVESGEVLPGFEGKRGVSGTEKVRIRSLVERTRVGVLEALKRGEFEDEGEGEGEAGEKMDVDTDTTDGELVLEGDGGADEEEEDSLDMQLARVYDRTIVELGDSLEAPNIGIITEGR